MPKRPLPKSIAAWSRQGYYTSVVVLMDEDRSRLEASARQVEKAVNRLGFAARIETINTHGRLPRQLARPRRRERAPAAHQHHEPGRPAADEHDLDGQQRAPCPMYPPLSPALMHCVTHGATPFRLNLHVRDLGHTFMFGPTGAGKSTHLGIIAAQLRRYAGMSIFAFDKGMSMYPLAAAIRAQTGGKQRPALHGGRRR
jgi:hypothetical protein